LDSQLESRPAPAEQPGHADNNQTEDPPTDQQARNPNDDRDTASDSEADTKTENRRP
jgi:hypothetical protein